MNNQDSCLNQNKDTVPNQGLERGEQWLEAVIHLPDSKGKKACLGGEDFLLNEKSPPRKQERKGKLTAWISLTLLREFALREVGHKAKFLVWDLTRNKTPCKKGLATLGLSAKKQYSDPSS